MPSSAKTAAASATARCASSTSLPQTQAPRWGSGGLCVLRSAARELRHRQGRAECSSYVLVNKYSPNGGQRGRSCHGSLPRWSPYAAVPPPELAHGQPGTQPLPPPSLPLASVSTTNDGGSGPCARSAQCPCKLRNGRCITFNCTELPSFYGGTL